MAYSRKQLELQEALRELVRRTGATNAFVFDAWGLIWCSAFLTFGDEQTRLYEQVSAVLSGVEPPLERGGRLERISADEYSAMYCVSFAVTYVVGVWLGPETNEFLLRRTVRAALPTIETLTSSLPPPHGSGSSSGAQRGRA